jgi:hypothetical protein
MNDITIKQSTVICGDHFEKDCFDGKQRLKEGAVPTLFKNKV